MSQIDLDTKVRINSKDDDRYDQQGHVASITFTDYDPIVWVRFRDGLEQLFDMSQLDEVGSGEQTESALTP